MPNACASISKKEITQTERTKMTRQKKMTSLELLSLFSRRRVLHHRSLDYKVQDIPRRCCGSYVVMMTYANFTQFLKGKTISVFVVILCWLPTRNAPLGNTTETIFMSENDQEYCVSPGNRCLRDTAARKFFLPSPAPFSFKKGWGELSLLLIEIFRMDPTPTYK